MRCGIWLSFLGGFVVTFGLLAAFVTKYTMLPSGQAVTRVTWWRYYLNEWPQFFRPQYLGPASVNQDSLVSTTLLHVLLAALGGLAVATIAWWLTKRASKRG